MRAQRGGNIRLFSSLGYRYTYTCNSSDITVSTNKSLTITNAPKAFSTARNPLNALMSSQVYLTLRSRIRIPISEKDFLEDSQIFVVLASVM